MVSILHVGNIAGVPQELSKAQRKLGLKSDVLTFNLHPFVYEIDLYYPTKLPYSLTSLRYIGPSLRCAEKIFNLLRISNKYDVFHFHFSSILPFGLDVLIWKFLRKKCVIHHHGSDIRYKGEPQIYSKFADRIFVSTPDLLEWSPDAIWIPNPISLDEFSYVGVEHKDKSENLSIVHAPSNRDIKGTKYVINAVKVLKSEGYKIRLILVENMSHKKAVEYYKQADIIVDWINPKFGIYGMFSIESMAFGKPVICYLREDLQKYYKNCPIVNANPQNLTEKLRTLIEDYTLRKKIGKRGRKYVEQVHGANKVTEKVIKLYGNKEVKR